MQKNRIDILLTQLVSEGKLTNETYEYLMEEVPHTYDLTLTDLDILQSVKQEFLNIGDI